MAGAAGWVLQCLGNASQSDSYSRKFHVHPVTPLTAVPTGFSGERSTQPVERCGGKASPCAVCDGWPIVPVRARGWQWRWPGLLSSHALLRPCHPAPRPHSLPLQGPTVAFCAPFCSLFRWAGLPLVHKLCPQKPRSPGVRAGPGWLTDGCCAYWGVRGRLLKTEKGKSPFDQCKCKAPQFGPP